MNALNPVFRPLLAGFALAGALVLQGQAQAATVTAPITTPLTSPLSVIGGYATDLTNVRGTFDPTWLNGASAYASTFDLTEMTLGGSLLLTQDVAKITFTLVGFESTLANTFSAGAQSFSNGTLGASFSFDNVAAGLLNFGFLTNGAGALKSNGHAATGLMLAEDNRSALILFNERFGDRDYDDMVVKMTIVPKLSVSPVPEPEALSMLLGGLGLMGLVARRRRRQQA